MQDFTAGPHDMQWRNKAFASPLMLAFQKVNPA